MMNLNSICATAQNAFISIAFEGFRSTYSPFAMIRSSFSAAPKMAFFSQLGKPIPFPCAFFGTCSFFVMQWHNEIIPTDYAFSRFYVSIPPIGKIAFHRTIESILAVFVRVKFISTLFAASIFARLFSACRNASFTLVPGSGLSMTFIRAVFSFSIPVCSATVGASSRLFLWSHNIPFLMRIIRQNRKHCKHPPYFEIAKQRIEQAQPALLEVV